MRPDATRQTLLSAARAARILDMPRRRGTGAIKWTALTALLYLAVQTILPRGLPIEALIPGAVIGGLSSLTAMGLVLIYRSSRTINFAQANMGGCVATLVVMLVTVLHWNYWLAVLLGIGVSLVLGASVERGLLGPLRQAPRLIVTVATIGVAQLMGGLTLYLAGADLGVGNWHVPSLFEVPQKFRTVVPFHAPWRAHAQAGSLLLTSDYFLAIAAVPVIAVGLAWFFNRTDAGIGARGAADSSERALLLGIPVRRLSLVTWLVASAMSSLGAILLAGVHGFQATTLGGPEILVTPLAAAVIGGFDSLVIAVVASVAIGVLQQAIYWSYPQSSVVDLVMFAVILVALVFHHRSPTRVGGDDLGGFVGVREPRPLPRQIARLPEVRTGRIGGLVAILLLVAVMPLWLGNAQLTFFAFVAIFVIVAASLVILAGWGGQVSLGCGTSRNSPGLASRNSPWGPSCRLVGGRLLVVVVACCWLFVSGSVSGLLR